MGFFGDILSTVTGGFSKALDFGGQALRAITPDPIERFAGSAFRNIGAQLAPQLQDIPAQIGAGLVQRFVPATLEVGGATFDPRQVLSDVLSAGPTEVIQGPLTEGQAAIGLEPGQEVQRGTFGQGLQDLFGSIGLGGVFEGAAGGLLGRQPANLPPEVIVNIDGRAGIDPFEVDLVQGQDPPGITGPLRDVLFPNVPQISPGEFAFGPQSPDFIDAQRGTDPGTGGLSTGALIGAPVGGQRDDGSFSLAGLREFAGQLEQPAQAGFGFGPLASAAGGFLLDQIFDKGVELVRDQVDPALAGLGRIADKLGIGEEPMGGGMLGSGGPFTTPGPMQGPVTQAQSKAGITVDEASLCLQTAKSAMISANALAGKVNPQTGKKFTKKSILKKLTANVSLAKFKACRKALRGSGQSDLQRLLTSVISARTTRSARTHSHRVTHTHGPKKRPKPHHRPKKGHAHSHSRSSSTRSKGSLTQAQVRRAFTRARKHFGGKIPKGTKLRKFL